MTHTFRKSRDNCQLLQKKYFPYTERVNIIKLYTRKKVPENYSFVDLQIIFKEIIRNFWEMARNGPNMVHKGDYIRNARSTREIESFGV